MDRAHERAEHSLDGERVERGQPVAEVGGRPRPRHAVVSRHGRRVCSRSSTPRKELAKIPMAKGTRGFGVYHASNLLCAVTWAVKPWSVVRRSTSKSTAPA